MDINKYGNVAIEQLHLVRVQDGLEGVRYDNGDLLITRNTQNTSDLSMRNTVHFTLNGVVSNHAYGEFNSLFAFISPFEKTAQKNENLLAGLNPSDTFFHQDHNNELRLHKPILVAPNGAEIPPELTESGLSIVRYDAPKVINAETLATTRNLAIANVFTVLNAPLHSVGMWGWSNVPNPTVEQREALLNRLGYQDSDIALAHTGSPEEKIEGIINAFAYHNEAILNGERLENTATGLQIPHTTMVSMARNQMHDALSEIKNEVARQKLTDKFNGIDQKFQQLIKNSQALENTDPAISVKMPEPDVVNVAGQTPPPPPIPEGMDTSGVTPPPPPPYPPQGFNDPVDLNDADVKSLNSFFEQSGFSDKLDKDTNELLAAPEGVANKDIQHLFDSHYYNQLHSNIHTSLIHLKNQIALSEDPLNNPDSENHDQPIYEAYNDVKNDFNDFNDHYKNLIQHIPAENQEHNMNYQLDLSKNLFDLTQEVLGDNQKTFNINGIEKSFSDDLDGFKDNHLKTVEKSLELNKSNVQQTLDTSREFNLN